MNNQLKDSSTGRLYPRMHRRSYTETGKKGRNAERAGPCTHVQQLRGWRDISAAKLCPGALVSTLCRDPQPRATEMERGAHIASGGKNQWVFSLPCSRRESARNPDTTFLGGTLSYQHLLAAPFCCAWVL